MKAFIAKYKHAWCLLYVFIYLPWFFFFFFFLIHYSIVHIKLDVYFLFNESYIFGQYYDCI